LIARKIVWPVYDGHFSKKLKDGSINGVPLDEIWKQCEKESRELIKAKGWNKVEIKNCPFCGHKDVRYYTGWKKGNRKYDNSKGRSPSITCERCGMGFSYGWFGRGITDKDAKEKTIEKWNNRYNDS